MRDGDAIEELEAVAKIDEVGIGVGHPLAVGRDRFEVDEMVGIGDAAQRLQHDRIDPCEGGGGGADADGQREHRDGCERGLRAIMRRP
jgi:hypothetical protein